MTLQKQVLPSIIKTEIENGLDFILSHFIQDKLFPRTIMTEKVGYQKEVFSRKEALQFFQESEYLDCRINAFPSYTNYKDIQRYPPDLIFIDLDKNKFQNNASFENALLTILKNIKKKLGDKTRPSVLETGGGYHIILPITCPSPLEHITEFSEYDKPSQEFLRFAKDFLSDGKADKNNKPSFRSCLLRIPGSINSKYGNKVKIIQKGNNYRPNLSLELLLDFKRYLRKKDIQNRLLLLMNSNRRNTNNNNNNNNSNNYYLINYYEWIEKLLQTPIEEYRKLVLWKILCPYLVNIKKFSPNDSFQILKEWLNKCNSLRKLDFNPNQKIKDNFKRVGNFYPLGIQKLKTDKEYSKLYQLLKEKIELNTSKNHEVKN